MRKGTALGRNGSRARSVGGTPPENATGATPKPAAGFASLGGGSEVPDAPSFRRRLGFLAIGLLNRLVPKSPKSVVLHATIDIEDGVLAVAEGLAARHWSATALLEDPTRAAALTAMSGGTVRALPKHSIRALVRFLTARHVMTTASLFGNVTAPRTQTLVNLWHGEPPTKVTGRFFGSQGGLRCTYAPVCSTVGRAYRAAEFDLHPSQVPIVGAPRNDRMMRADGAAVRRALLGAEATRPTLLWLPSFRRGQFADQAPRIDTVGEHYPGVPFGAADIAQLDAALDDVGARIVVKLHPHDIERFSGDYRSIRVLTQRQMADAGLTLYPMLAAFDGLVTDMSSVWVDYLLLDRPMVFAFPDVDQYRDGRGLNLEPFEDWVPGPFVRTVDELVAAITDVVAGRDPMAEERGRARRRFHHFIDDGSTARLLDGLGVH